ncbi:MAG TPA: ATP synthase F0 subunit B [Desulfobaccales bacterium]
MKRGNRTGWQWSVGTLLSLGFSLALAGVALASEAAHGGHGGVDSAKLTELLWRTVNFVVFAAILIKLVAKPAKNFFGKRSKEIAESLEDLEAKKAAAAAALKEAEARLAEVASEREAIIKMYMAEGETEKAKILDKANEVAARLKEMAALTIQQEVRKATQSLREEVADLSAQMAEDLIKEKATFADQQGLVEEYLKKVVETH